jgi:hypothetical protein
VGINKRHIAHERAGEEKGKKMGTNVRKKADENTG